MLVVISDIHFVDGTAGEHNLPFEAFKSVFLTDIAALAREKKAKKLKILLLGDIIDLIRSTVWLDKDPAERPWGEKGLLDIPDPKRGSPIEKTCLEILGKVTEKSLEKDTPPAALSKNTILFKNWRTFKLFRNLKKNLQEIDEKTFFADLPLEIVYIPGNHDRMINLYPSLRKLLAKYMGLTVNPETIDGNINDTWFFKNTFLDPVHGVWANHGHQHDIWNFADINDLSALGYLDVPIGDVLTTEFAVKIPWLLAKLKPKYPAITNEVIHTAEDIDNVRPLSAVMEWLYYKFRNDQIKDAFDEVFATVVKELLDNKLVKQWRSPGTHIDEYLRAASSRWLSWLPKAIVSSVDAEDLLPILMGMTDKPTTPEQDIYAKAAYDDSLWKRNRDIRFILKGHTHQPLYYALDGAAGREVLYINTGTWRNRINKTIAFDRAPDFVQLKQMTYTIFYSKDEDLSGKETGSLSFDMWNGIKKKQYTRD